MRPSATLFSALLLLAACGDATTAPEDLASVSARPVPELGEQSATISCVAVNTPGAYSATVSWARVKVLNVSITTENGTLTTPLPRPKRKGTVTFAPTSETLGFRLDDGVQTIASGGCATP